MAFAVTAAHEAALSKATGNLEDLSEETLYWHCKQIDGDQDSGTTFESAATALEQEGQPTEDKWPYDGGRDETAPDYTPPPAALDPGNCHKATLQNVVATAAEIKRLLGAERPVALGILICDSFLIAPGGVIPLPLPNQAFIDGHALLVAGYEDGAAADEGHFILRNSWGDTWGDNGYGYLPYAYLQQHGGVAWIIDP